MSEIKIQKGVPVPSRYKHRVDYPFAEMEVGDCFDLPAGEKPGSTRVRVANHASNHSMITKTDFRVSVRLIALEKILRVWRVK